MSKPTYLALVRKKFPDAYRAVLSGDIYIKVKGKKLRLVKFESSNGYIKEILCIDKEVADLLGDKLAGYESETPVARPWIQAREKVGWPYSKIAALSAAGYLVYDKYDSIVSFINSLL